MGAELLFTFWIINGLKIWTLLGESNLQFYKSCDKRRFYLAKLTHPTIVRLQKNYEHLFKGALKVTLQKDF